MPTSKVSENFLGEFAISRNDLTMFMYDLSEKYESHKKIILETGTVMRCVVEKQTLHSFCLETKLSFVSVDMWTVEITRTVMQKVPY